MLIAFLLAASSAVPTATAPSVLPPVVVVVRDDDEEEFEDKREEVKTLLEKLKGHVGKRGEQDTEAVATIDSLLQEFPQSGPKDRASIVKGLGKCFEAKRRDLENGSPNNKLYLASAICLGEMGKDATKTLQKYIGNKKHRSNLSLQRALILSLGKTKDESAVKDLVDLLKHKDNTIISSAAEALANFDDADLKVRKMAFNELLKILVTTKALMDGDANDIISRDRYDAIGTQIINTLRDLSGHDAGKPEEWQRWWNKNKKKDWDEEED